MRIALRKFLKLPRNFKTEILSQVFPIDFTEWISVEHRNNCSKWECRKRKRIVEKENLMKYTIPYKKYLPLEFASLLKKFTVWCRECQRPFYPEHLEEHGISRIKIEDLFEDLVQIENKFSIATPKGLKKGNRKEIVEAFTQHLKKFCLK